MRPELLAILGIFLSFALAEILFTRFFNKAGQTRGDGWFEVFSTTLLIGFTQPLVIGIGAALAAFLAPGAKDILLGQPWLLTLVLLLIFDDMAQYWWHRLSHSVPWLYKLHRPHHEAAYMSIRIVYRNNSFYYLLMPSLWFAGMLLHLGSAPVYGPYLVVKLAVIMGAHSDIKWDAWLLKQRWFSPVMWVVERIISTPATHFAHHGKHAADGVTNYKGNYGNLLFFWDVLFCTAKITRRYPTEFGVENLPPTSLGEQMFWPLIRLEPTPNPKTQDGVAAE